MDDETKRNIWKGIVITVCIILGIGPFTFLKDLFEDKPELPVGVYPITPPSSYEESEAATSDDNPSGYVDEQTENQEPDVMSPTSGGYVYPVVTNTPEYVQSDGYSEPPTNNTVSEPQSPAPKQRKKCISPCAIVTDAYCGGNGICSHCCGSGWVSNPFGCGNDICTYCQGTGKCAKCHGTGYLD